MKRFLSILLVLYITLKASAVSYLVNGMYYHILNNNNKTAELYWSETNNALMTEFTGVEGVITVPSTVVINGETYTVIKIGNSAFYGCNEIKNVIIPNTVKSIGVSAFSMSGITSIEIPNSVQRIDDSAFINCVYLTSVKLSNTLNQISRRAFYRAFPIKSILIPKTVVSIGDEAFYYVDKLKKVFLRNSDPSIITFGYSVFDYTPNDLAIYVPPGTKYYYLHSIPNEDIKTKIVEEGSNALHFDGVDDNVSLPMEYYKHGVFTIEMWIKPDVIPATGFAALLNTDSWNSDANGNSVHFQISDSKLSLAINGITDGYPTSNYTLVPNVWQHIAVTYERGVAVKFYVNGNLVSTVTKSYIMPMVKFDAASLGSWAGTSRFFHGAIDEVRVWSSVRTEQEIKDNMNVSFENTSYYLPVNQQYISSDLSLNYNFNHGIDSQDNMYATDLTDYSSSKWDGILKNFALSGSTSNFVKGVDFPILYVSSKKVDIGAANNSQSTITVSSNVAWNVVSDQSWLVIPASGTGNGTLTFTATENPTASTRTATVTVSATGTAAKTISITQAASISTGIEMLGKETLSIYPNSTQKGFTVNVGDQKSTLSIYDLNGSLILTKQISGKSYIDIASLPSGVYTVKANGLVGKLIKK